MTVLVAHVAGLVRRAQAPEQAGIFAGQNPATWNKSDPLRLWIIQLVIIIGMTQVLALFLSRIRQPRVIAEVIGGVILGPTIMGRIPNFTKTVFPPESIPGLALTANIGLVLFLFLVGMEIDTRVIRRNAKASAIVSVAGLVIPLGLGAAVAVPIYHEFTDGSSPFGLFVLFVAVAVGITAFPVLCRILTELKLLDTTVGVVVLSAGVGNDVVGWILLALTVALINASSGLTALWVLLSGVAYVLFVCFPVNWGYRWVAKKSGSLDAGVPSAMMMTVTVVLVFISAFYTDIIGIHPIFGGFIAGLIIPKDNGYAIALVEKLEDLVAIVLLPIYFALSGLNTNLGLLNEGKTWGYVFLTCTVAFFAKFLGAGIAAKLAGFNLRESSAIGALMSCKGLVELIVLNVGLAAGVLDQRTFSMFVLMALILTFVTTPLTILFYPPKYRVHAGQIPVTRGESSVEAGGTADQSEFKELLKTRFSVVVDKIDQLPAVMTLTQLLQRPTPLVYASLQSSTNIPDEKASEAGVPSLAHSTRPRMDTKITINALRLIELTNRTSAVLMSQAADALLHSDPILAIFKTFGYLNRVAVSTALAVVGYDDFSENIAEHARNSSSQMVIIPWTSDGASIDDVAKAHAENESSGPSTSPFDVLFQQKRERDHNALSASSHYLRRVYAEAPADVALFWERGYAQGLDGDVRYEVFMPFFGGPDDRAALAFVVQLCMSPLVSAKVVKMKKVDGEPIVPVDSIGEIKANLHNTIHSTVFPDTVYGAQNTEVALASETADNLLWAKVTQDTAPEFADALSRIYFSEEGSPSPLQAVIDLATKQARPDARQLVVVGRSRRMAVESHRAELQVLYATRGGPLGSELPKTLGDVAAGFVAAGSSASMLVMQAARR
ncbi:cation/H+ exchanger [Epithele typhae]|uniref:cation/H+ exchanger n=1 Tax=Epithele typhae TaxID=378194 RepID=UPI00200752E9|nr:cation/H+ exchanger [Epithele typhae]KAH9943171.1 cation/H+ exchanger [Epithele typhae]